MINVEPIVILYAWGLITEAKVAELFDVPLDRIQSILARLRDKAELFRNLADGPAVGHYQSAVADWSYERDNRQHP
jgi:hypothetical protein